MLGGVTVVVVGRREGMRVHSLEGSMMGGREGGRNEVI